MFNAQIKRLIFFVALCCWLKQPAATLTACNKQPPNLQISNFQIFKSSNVVLPALIDAIF